MGYFSSEPVPRTLSSAAKNAAHNLKLFAQTGYDPKYDYLLSMAIGELKFAQTLAKEQNDATNLSNQ
jgi:hypothetical protein